MLIASVAWYDVILHARLIFLLTMQPRNPWQMLAEPLGSAEPRLKITDLNCSCHSITAVNKYYLDDRLIDFSASDDVRYC